MDESKRSEELVLFPEAKVKVSSGGVEEELILKPWSFGTLIDLNPHLAGIFSDLS